MQRNTITVVTPVHPNRIKNGLFAECLQSIHQQTLLPDAHAVAIDNEAAGAAATRQRALDMARTEWVAFLDSDDLFMEKHLERMLRYALETEADFVYSWFKLLQDFGGGQRRVLEEDPIFPPTHYLNPWDPENPIETTITTFVRTELAQAVGFQQLDRGEINSGEDRYFTLGCQAAGGKIVHLRRKTWLWRHMIRPDGTLSNTAGLPTKGDAVSA
jgi:glycosyltransferase involved in cell wall biosynthesis